MMEYTNDRILIRFEIDGETRSIRVSEDQIDKMKYWFENSKKSSRRTDRLNRTLFKINELSDSARRRALASTSKLIKKQFYDIEVKRILNELQYFCEKYKVTYKDSFVSLNEWSYVDISVNPLQQETIKNRKRIADEINSVYLRKISAASFEGTYQDLFFDFFKENGITTPDSVASHITYAMQHAMSKFIREWQNKATQEQYIIDYAESNDFYYDTVGTLIN